MDNPHYQRQRVIRSEREKVQEKELSEIEKAYTDLKATQALIQSEKWHPGTYRGITKFRIPEFDCIFRSKQ
jgi:hypothetical protein